MVSKRYQRKCYSHTHRSKKSVRSTHFYQDQFGCKQLCSTCYKRLHRKAKRSAERCALVDKRKFVVTYVVTPPKPPKPPIETPENSPSPPKPKTPRRSRGDITITGVARERIFGKDNELLSKPSMFTRNFENRANLKDDSNVIVSLKMLLESYEKCGCPQVHCKGKLCAKFSEYGIAPSIALDVKCTKFGHQVIKQKMVEKNFLDKLVGSCAINGEGYAGLKRFFTYIDGDVISSGNFQARFNRFCDCIDECVDESLCEKRRLFVLFKIINKYNEIHPRKAVSAGLQEKVSWYYRNVGNFVEVVGGFDGSYSHRRNSHWHFNHFVEFETGEGSILFRICLRKAMMRNVSESEWWEKYQGASIKMECYGLDLLCESILEEEVEVEGFTFKFKLKMVCLDGDLNGGKIVLMYFPACVIARCWTHKKKNLKKSKELTRFRLGTAVSCGFAKCLGLAKGSEAMLRKLFDIYPYHLIGDHEKCTEGCTHPEGKVHSKHLDLLIDVFSELKKDAAVYYLKLTVNSNENLHTVQTQFTAGKRKHRSRNQGSVTSLAVLKRNHGEDGIFRVFVAFGAASKKMMFNCEKRELRNLYFKDYKKLDVVARRQRKKARSIRNKDSFWTGTGSYKRAETDSEFNNRDNSDQPTVREEEEVEVEVNEKKSKKKKKKKKKRKRDEEEVFLESELAEDDDSIEIMDKDETRDLLSSMSNREQEEIKELDSRESPAGYSLRGRKKRKTINYAAMDSGSFDEES